MTRDTHLDAEYRATTTEDERPNDSKTMTPTIEVHDSGDVTEYSPEEYIDEIGNAARVRLHAIEQAQIDDGTLADEVPHNSHVVERAIEEDAFSASVTVPYWFLQKDEEVGEEFSSKNERVRCLVEDYSEKAWRVIAKRVDTRTGDTWYNWSWTFLPKSVVTVTRVTDVLDLEDAYRFGEHTRELERERREEREREFEEADGWEEKLELVDN